MAAFTSWSVLKTAVLDALMAGNIFAGSYSIGGRSISFRSLREVQDFLSFCDMQISAEAGGATAYAKFERPGGTDEE